MGLNEKVMKLHEKDFTSYARLAKRQEILIFPRMAGNTGNSWEILVIPGIYWETGSSATKKV